MDTGIFNTTNQTESEESGETNPYLWVPSAVATTATLLGNLLLILALVTLRSVHLNKSTRYFLIYRASCYLVVVLAVLAGLSRICSLLSILATCCGLLVASSMLLQSLDSFITMFRPFSYKQIMTARRARLAILVTVTAVVGVSVQMILIEERSYHVPCTASDAGFPPYLVIVITSVMLMLMLLSAVFQMSTIFLIWQMNQVHPSQPHPTKAQIPGPVLEMKIIQRSHSNVSKPGPSSENIQRPESNLPIHGPSPAVSPQVRDCPLRSRPETISTSKVTLKCNRSPTEETSLTIQDNQAEISNTLSRSWNNPTLTWKNQITDNPLVLKDLPKTLMGPATTPGPPNADINSLPVTLNSLPVNLNRSSATSQPQRNRPTRRGRLVRLLTLSMIVTLICWVPRLIMTIMISVYDVYGIERTALAVAKVKVDICIALDCILFPVIVLMLSSELRGAVKALLLSNCR